MQILLDEQLNWRLARVFNSPHEVYSVRDMDWTGMQNGDLLRLAAREFDVMVTMDRNMEHEQDLLRYNLAVILLLSTSNRLEDTKGFVPEVERLLALGVEPGHLYRVTS